MGSRARSSSGCGPYIGRKESLQSSEAPQRDAAMRQCCSDYLAHEMLLLMSIAKMRLLKRSQGGELSKRVHRECGHSNKMRLPVYEV